ncbi:hypothetical protein HZB69_01210 [Candidatus Amesbacteria bacterium]|nr:hypothetical protein [Candidatus Amesbacteria bacterium]
MLPFCSIICLASLSISRSLYLGQDKILKVLGIVWPPLPGGILTLDAIPFIGWFPAYLVDFFGSTVGSSVAFLIGRKYGYPFLQKLFDESTIDKIKHLKIKPHREIEAVTALRIFIGSLFLGSWSLFQYLSSSKGDTWSRNLV